MATPREVLSVRLPQGLVTRLRGRAALDSEAVTAVVERALRAQLDDFSGGGKVLQSITMNLKLSEARESLLKLQQDGADDKTVTKAIDEVRKFEARYRQAAAADEEEHGVVVERVIGQPRMDAAMRETMKIASKADVGAMLHAMGGGASAPAGAMSELQAAAGVASNVIPWTAMVDPDGLPGQQIEKRADALSPASGYTSAPAGMQAIIDYVFAPSVAVTGLGARMEHPDYGDSVLTVITEKATSDIKARGATLEAETKAITAVGLEPKRLQSRIGIAWEDMVRLGPGLERAIRQHLRSAAAETLDKGVLGTQSSPVAGILSTAAQGGLPDLTAASSTLDYAAALALASSAIDGTHAQTSMDVMLLLRPEVVSKLRSLAISNTSDTAYAAVAKLVARIVATKNLPAPASNVSTGVISRMGAGPGSGLVVAVWSGGMEIFRDIHSDGADGGIIFTSRMGVSWSLTHKSAYSRVSAKTA